MPNGGGAAGALDLSSGIGAGQSKTAGPRAMIPSTIQVVGDPQAPTPAVRPTKPVKAIPIPTPANIRPDHCSRPLRASIGIAHADTPTSAKADAIPAPSRNKTQPKGQIRALVPTPG